MNFAHEFRSFFTACRTDLKRMMAFCLALAALSLSLGAHAAVQFALPASSQDEPHPGTVAEPQSHPTLLIQTDFECIFRLDDAPPQRLAAGEIKRVATVVGEHVLTAISADRLDTWQTVVTVDQPVQKVIAIALLKPRKARQQAETEAARLELEIAGKRKKARETKAAAENLREQRVVNPARSLGGTGQNASTSNFVASQPLAHSPLGALPVGLANPKDPESLVAAANSGQLDLVRDLLSRGADVNAAACSSNGCTRPLTAAVLEGDQNLVSELLSAGADANTRADPKHSARTVLMDAAAVGKPEVVNLLLSKGAAVNATDLKQRTALMWASLAGDREAIQLLLSHGADVTTKDSEGSTAASIARNFHHDELVPMLEKSGKPNPVHLVSLPPSTTSTPAPFASGQISAAIARGSRQAGQPMGLLLQDSASQMFQALGQFSAQQGQLTPGTQVSASGFQVRIFTPLEWIAHEAADASAGGRPFTENTLDAEMVRPVLRVWALPSTPPQVGPNYGWDVSSVVNVVLRDSSRKRQIQPLSRKAFAYERLQGLQVEFSLDDLRSIRETDPEFFVSVVGTGSNWKDFKVKKKHFSGLPL